MKRHMSRGFVGLSVMAVFATAALLSPAAGFGATSHNVKFRFVGTFKNGVLKATIHGGPFDRCHGDGKTNPDNTTNYKMTCPKGTIKLHLVGKCGLNNVQCGTWKALGGTGPWRHLTGGGTFSGKISNGYLTYKGRVRY